MNYQYSTIILNALLKSSFEHIGLEAILLTLLSNFFLGVQGREIGDVKFDKDGDGYGKISVK